ncbi:MAG: hypothetical protein K6E51_00455 [Treponema sp.]|nr:hypothetical protein [Treponema sp.]
MKHLCKLLVAGIATSIVFIGVASADTSITINWNGGTYTTTVPDEIATIINSNMSSIVSSLNANNVDSTTLGDAVTEAKDAYTDFLANNPNMTTTPYTTSVNSLNDFCENLNDSIPDTQVLQNVWAEAWIGKFIPNFKFGFGVNAGVAALDIRPLKSAANALNIDTGSLKDIDTLVFPTLTADVRLGGIILPFDIGLALSVIDTEKISAIDSAIKPCAFDYFSIGGDVRYRLVDVGGKYIHARLSATAGGYYTKGSVSVEDNGSSANLDFKSTTLFLGAQGSGKFLCLVPFLGGRLMFTKSKVDWNAHANWANLLNTSSTGDSISQALQYNILPENFGGGASSGWGVRPQIYGGIGIDLFIIDLTASVGYDIAKKIPSGAMSVRFSI